jgi:hypothetical protein
MPVTAGALPRRGSVICVKRLGMISALVAAALLNASCGGDDSGSTQGPGAPAACTEIGCDSGLFLDLSPIAARMPVAKKVKVCLEGHCQTFSAKEPQAMIVDRKLNAEQSVTVTVTATDATGKVLLRESKSVRTVRAQPNGPDCPPVCFQVPLKLDAHTLHLERASS